MFAPDTTMAGFDAAFFVKKLKSTAGYFLSVALITGIFGQATLRGQNSNPPNYSFGAINNNVYTVGEMFTPLQNMTITSITLPVGSYYDNASQPQNSTLSLSINLSTENPGINPEPGNVSLGGDGMTLNSGTGPSYTFSCPVSLRANTDYWILLYLSGPDANQQRNFSGISANWGGIESIQSVQCSIPAQVVIDGSEHDYGSLGPDPSSYRTIGETLTMPVPEPSTMALGGLGVMLGLFCGVRRKR